MNLQQTRHPFIALLAAIAFFAFAGHASADPPTRVARMGYLDGPVSFSPAGENEWVGASLNRPLVTGDRLWVDAGARVELQIGTAAVRVGEGTSITLLNLDDRIAQVDLAQGRLDLRVRRIDPNQVIEVDTPNLAFSIRRPGQYRIEVDPAGNATMVVTRAGQAEVYGEGAAYVVDAGRAYRFYGTGLQDYESLALAQPDEFDRWAMDRDRRYDSSVSARFVSRDVIGYQDLDANGTWAVEPGYGNVWIPTRVASDWAPYRDGHWAWVDPWGWTWIDDAPWGFAVSHYGRWANFRGRWGWVPGPVAARAVYAPALVAFVGGSNFQIAISSGSTRGIGWFPLGPRDVYRPAYPVSRTYFTNVNTSNTVINNVNITNVYNQRDVSQVTYVNQQVPGAVIAVPTTAFVQAQPVARVAVRMQREALMQAPVSTVAAVAPQQASVHGPAPAGRQPPAQVVQRPVFARTEPPAPPVSFAAKERQLATNPGRPLDQSALNAIKPAPAASAPRVEVLAPARVPGPAAAPPPRAPQEGRAKGEQRAQPLVPVIPPQGMPTPQPVQRGQAPAAVPVTPPAPAATPQPVQRGQPPAAPGAPPVIVPTPEPKGKAEQRGQQQVAPPPQPAVVPTPEPKGKAEQRGQPQIAPTPQPGNPPAPEPRGRAEQRGQPPIVPQPQPAAVPAPVPAPEPKGKGEPRGPAPAAQPPQPAIAPMPPQQRGNAAPPMPAPPPVVQPPAQVAPPAPMPMPMPPQAPKGEPRREPAPPPQGAMPAPPPNVPAAPPLQQRNVPNQGAMPVPPPAARPAPPAPAMPPPAARPPEPGAPGAAPAGPPPNLEPRNAPKKDDAKPKGDGKQKDDEDKKGK